MSHRGDIKEILTADWIYDFDKQKFILYYRGVAHAQLFDVGGAEINVHEFVFFVTCEYESSLWYTGTWNRLKKMTAEIFLEIYEFEITVMGHETRQKLYE